MIRAIAALLANVDARRAEVGLGTLEAYYEEFRESIETDP